MTRDDIKEVINEVLISYIAERVAEKLAERLAMQQKEALVVFTGALMGFDTAMEGLNKLKSDGFNFHVFLTESANKLLDVSRIENELQPKDIYKEGQIVPEQLAAQYDTVIVPTMTINTAAKLACCIADTTATRMISNAIMRGKNVIMGVDGCCPENKARVAKGYKMTEPLKAQLNANLKKIASYGGYLTTLENLYDSTNKKVFGQKPEKEQEVKATATGSSTSVGSECKLLSQKVIGSADIMANSGCKIIKISSNALLTKMAEEMALQRKIKIIRE